MIITEDRLSLQNTHAFFLQTLTETSQLPLYWLLIFLVVKACIQYIFYLRMDLNTQHYLSKTLLSNSQHVCIICVLVTTRFSVLALTHGK